MNLREQDSYSGFRVTVPCTLATARLNFHVDVNVGDVVWPAPRAVELPRLLVGNNRIVFNVGGNNYRLVVVALFQASTLYVRFVGTHAEYDRIDVAEV